MNANAFISAQVFFHPHFDYFDLSTSQVLLKQSLVFSFHDVPYWLFEVAPE